MTGQKPKTNPLLVQALDLALKLAGQPSGNWGVWRILDVMLMAYKSGQIVTLARHVEAWQNETQTSSLMAVGGGQE